MARVALVTGGSRGIGAAISKALKDAGYSVAANYAGNDEAAAAFKAETGIPVYKWSVADYQACADGIAKVEADLGPVDVLVNNAGITRDAPFHRMTPEQWNEVISTNLTGVFNMTHPVWSGMRDRKFGRVVTISSVNGQKGQFAQANYSASRSAVWARPTRSRAAWCSWRPTKRASSPARPSRPMAGSSSAEPVPMLNGVGRVAIGGGPPAQFGGPPRLRTTTPPPPR